MRAAGTGGPRPLHVYVGEVDLHTCQEHQENEAKLGQKREQRIFVGHPAETAAADDDPRQDFADDDRQPEPPKAREQQWHDKRQRDDD